MMCPQSALLVSGYWVLGIGYWVLVTGPPSFVRIVRLEKRTAEYRMSNIDMAAKRLKKHKNKISRLVISMCYNERKSKF
jgi:hypothetical protein